MDSRGATYVLTIGLWSERILALAFVLLVSALCLSASAPAGLPDVTVRAARSLQGPGHPGYDVSWPQCSRRDGGYGLPKPRDDARFVIIGLTRGRPFTVNPCLTEQVDHAWMRDLPAHAYTIPAYPTPTQLRRTGDRGPWRTTTEASRLRNSGYAQATFALHTMAAVGFRPPMVWLDVEHLDRQPWPRDTASERVANRQVLLGMMRGFADAGITFGLYSYPRGWQEITDGWQVEEVPVWATAGRSTRSAAQDRCRERSFSGGPVLLAQWYDSVRDSNITCDRFTLVPPVPLVPTQVGAPTEGH
jgi:hypothetical protein